MEVKLDLRPKTIFGGQAIFQEAYFLEFGPQEANMATLSLKVNRLFLCMGSNQSLKKHSSYFGAKIVEPFSQAKMLNKTKYLLFFSLFLLDVLVRKKIKIEVLKGVKFVNFGLKKCQSGNLGKDLGPAFALHGFINFYFRIQDLA